MRLKLSILMERVNENPVAFGVVELARQDMNGGGLSGDERFQDSIASGAVPP